MNRYLQKILEIKFHFLLNIVYRFKYPNLLRQNQTFKTSYSKPLISIVVPIYRPKISWLTDCIDSVINQNYQNWQLILVDDHSDNPEITQTLQKYKSNPKIKIIVNSTNLNIVGATNVGLKIATGKWIGFLDHDDVLWPSALSQISTAINQNSTIQYIYTDQDKIDQNNHHFDPFLKPDFKSKLLYQTNYFNHFSVIKKSLLIKLNYLRLGTSGAQDWDLALRASQIIKPSQILHIPHVCYSWRVSPNSTASTDGMIKNHQKISKIQQEVLEFNNKSNFSQTRYLGIWSTDHQPTILPYQFYLISLFKLILSR